MGLRIAQLPGTKEEYHTIGKLFHYFAGDFYSAAIDADYELDFGSAKNPLSSRMVGSFPG